jgi:hypothetical protein
MEEQVIECPACRARVRYRPDLRDGPLSCPECGEHLLGERDGIRHRPERPQDVRPPARREREADRDRGRDRRRGRDRWEREPPPSKAPWVIGIAIGAVLLIVVGIGVAGYLVMGGKRQRVISANNLRQIGTAAHNHHDATGSFPANLTGPDGRPLLSWRVALLPYLEQEALYRQFRLDEPWDSEHNRRLLTQMPKLYVVPGREREAAEGLTFYQGFAGPGAVFDTRPGMRLRLADVTDGTSNTLLAVEAADPVPWTKPADLPFDPAGPLPRLGGHHRGGFNALLCDGSIRFVPDRINEQTLRALITYNGGEVVAPDW